MVAQESVDLAALRVGDELPRLVTEAVSCQTLALYADASGNHDPRYIDSSQARKAGLHDVITPGMLVAAYLGRALTAVVPQLALRSLTVRFAGVTQVGDTLDCCATVIERLEDQGEPLLRLKLRVTNAWGDLKLDGEALVALAATAPAAGRRRSTQAQTKKMPQV